MSWYSILAVYFILWWLCFFAVLPWGVKTQAEADDVVPGTTPSAPVRPNLILKGAVTSVVAAVVLATALWLIHSGILTLDSLPGLKPPPHPGG